jgi:hypothetical protein
MKWILGLSLILNLALGFKLYFSIQEAPRERLIIETHPMPQECSPKVIIKECQDKKPRNAKVLTPPSREHPETRQDWRIAQERLEMKRLRFFEDELLLSPTQIEQYEKLQLKLEKLQSEVEYPPEFVTNEKSFEGMRKQIDVQENHYKEVRNLFGKERWERYHEFLRKHNEQVHIIGDQENEPFIFISP